MHGRRRIERGGCLNTWTCAGLTPRHAHYSLVLRATPWFSRLLYGLDSFTRPPQAPHVGCRAAACACTHNVQHLQVRELWHVLRRAGTATACVEESRQGLWRPPARRACSRHRVKHHARPCHAFCVTAACMHRDIARLGGCTGLIPWTDSPKRRGICTMRTRTHIYEGREGYGTRTHI